MVEDGLMERFGIEQVFGLHVYPGQIKNTFAIRYGPALAAVDEFSIRVLGRGGHAAKPQATLDPIIAASNDSDKPAIHCFAKHRPDAGAGDFGHNLSCWPSHECHSR